MKKKKTIVERLEKRWERIQYDRVVRTRKVTHIIVVGLDDERMNETLHRVCGTHLPQIGEKATYESLLSSVPHQGEVVRILNPLNIDARE